MRSRTIRVKFTWPVILKAFLLLSAPFAHAQEAKDWKVNDDISEPANSQLFPSVAMSASGWFIITWADGRRPGCFDIYARIFNSTGVPQGPDFKVNDSSLPDDFHPRSATVINSEEIIIVTWEDYRDEPWGAQIWMQKFDSLGNRIGENQRVDTFGACVEPTVAVSNTGKVVIAWRSHSISAWARLLDKNGVPLGPEFKVSDDLGATYGGDPTVQWLGDDRFLVAWSTSRNNNNQNAIYGQLYDSSAIPIGTNFQMSDSGIDAHYPSLSLDSSGTLYLAWNAFFDGAYLKRFDSNVSPIGAAVKASESNMSTQPYPVAVAQSGNHGVALFWYGFTLSGPLRYKHHQYMQRFDPTGQFNGGNIIVSEVSQNGGMSFVDVASDLAGKFVACWSDGRNDLYLPNANFDIFAQMFSPLGVKIGGNFRVTNDAGTGTHQSASIAPLGYCSSIIVWADNRNNEGRFNIFGQIYGMDGAPEGTNFKINLDTVKSHSTVNPAVAANNAGRFASSWEKKINLSPEGRLYLRIFDEGGLTSVEEMVINSETDTLGYNVALAMDESGRVFAVWEDKRNGKLEIFMQRINSAGNLMGYDIKVNDNDNVASSFDPEIATDPYGNLLVTWTEVDSITDRQIMARLFDREGNARGACIIVGVDHGSENDNRNSYTAYVGGGNFVLAWNDYNQADPAILARIIDTSGTVISDTMNISAASLTSRITDISADDSGNFAIAGLVGHSDPYYNWTNAFSRAYGISGSPKGNVLEPDSLYWVNQKSPVVTINGRKVLMAWADPRRYGDSSADIFAHLYELIPTGIDYEASQPLPSELQLGQNHPNPFNPITSIEFHLPVRSNVAIEILNLLGQQVRTLVNRDFPAGWHKIEWDGTNSSGQLVASGIYLYRLTSGNKGVARKMVMLK